MLSNSQNWLILVFSFLEFIGQTHLTVHDNSHGFVNHEKYMISDIAGYHEGFSSGVRSSVISDLNLKYLLKFDPEFLDFRQRPLGVPHLEKVTLHNVHDNRSIDMTSISGSTVHFHSSFFEDKKIPPLGNTTFNVVFLGREEGAIESDLFIHTTEGRFKYQVKGASVHSPYRLRPIVGIKLPLNATFTPFIYMYNPYPNPIQVTEMYSSGGDFHLELPSGELEGPKDMWEILPYQTKAIIKVRFQARTEQNHTAYVRIKVNNTEEVLVVPLEVEVTSSASLFTTQGSVDFGVGGSLDTGFSVPLMVQNPTKKMFRVHSISSTSSAVKIQYQNNVRVPPDSKNNVSTLIANLTVDWKTAFDSKDFSGKIIVRYKSNRSHAEIPFYLTVLEGGVSFDETETRYFLNSSEKLRPRNVTLKNNYDTTVMLINVSLSSDIRSLFYVTNFRPDCLAPGHETMAFVLKLRNGKSLSQTSINSFVTVRTNVSDIRIPVLSYSGKLDVLLPFTSKDNSLDLGLVSTDSTKEVHFLVVNKNPVNVTLGAIKTSIPSSNVEIIACYQGDYSSALLRESYTNATRWNNLKMGQYAVLLLRVRSFNSEGQIWGDVSVETQYEQLSVPVHFRIAHGKLEIGPDRLVFDRCFPGKLCSHPLKVHSTFSEPMVIEDIVSLPPDLRITSKHSGIISARTTKVVGHLYLDPSLGCRKECYCGLHQDTSAQWLKTLALQEGVSEFDLNTINVFYSRYLNQTNRWQNLTMRLDTSQVRGHVFRTRVKMSWPNLLQPDAHANRSLIFPLTQVDGVSYQNVTLYNPSSHNLVVQIVLDTDYPEFEELREGLPPYLLPKKWERMKKANERFFLMPDSLALKRKFEDALEYDFDERTVPLYLFPGENVTFTVGYRALDAVPYWAALLLRNNLTILQVVGLNGRGAYHNFKFGNRKPGSSLPLSFELTEKHLKDCERSGGKYDPPPSLTVKRSFTARNMGDIPVRIGGFYVNGMSCEGYGFKVLNCESFLLLPNSTKKIDIAFTSDFTLAKVNRVLLLETSLNFPVNYTLMSTIPPYYLPLCSNAVPRPSWEAYVYYVAVILMTFSLLFVVITPVVDSERIMKRALVLIVSRNCPSTQPTLDLRLLGQETRSEIRQKLEAGEANRNNLRIEKEEEKKLEEELLRDKSPVFFPSVPKPKKKLSKKTSNELANESSPVQKKICNGDTNKPHKNRSEDKKAETRKPSVSKRSLEEETCSIMTESSSSNEDLEKTIMDVKQKQEIVTTTRSKIERRRPNRNKRDKDNRFKNPGEMKRNNMRIAARERHISKPGLATRTHHISSTPSSVWNEKRATFSDVVSRTDQTSKFSPISPYHPSKSRPQETFSDSSPTAELGPIGSRKFEYWQQRPLSHSFFTDGQGVTSGDGSNMFMDFWTGEEWERRSRPSSNLMNLMQTEEPTVPIQQPPNLQGAWTYNTNPNGLRDSLYTPLGESPQSQLQCSSQPAFLWGSSSVWQPWAPEKPRTPTRTPPGFTQHELDLRVQQQQQNQLYSPFSASSIWNQQQLTNPWDYQQQEQ